MNTDKVGNNPLDLIYEDQNLATRFRPFVVAPVGQLQDMLIIGPRSVAKQADEFIGKLYRGITIDNATFRSFPFAGSRCLAIALPGNTLDSGGRMGALLSIGIFHPMESSETNLQILSQYLEFVFKIMNRRCGVSFTVSDVDSFLFKLKQINDDHQFQFSLQGALDELLMAAQSLEILIHGSEKAKPRWQLKMRKPTRCAQHILYPASMSFSELLPIFLKESLNGINIAGSSFLQHDPKNTNLPSDTSLTIRFIPATWEIGKAHRAEIAKIRDIAYIRVTS